MTDLDGLAFLFEMLASMEKRLATSTDIGGQTMHVKVPGRGHAGQS